MSVSLKISLCLFFSPQNTDPEEEVVEGVQVAILTVYEDGLKVELYATLQKLELEETQILVHSTTVNLS